MHESPLLKPFAVSCGFHSTMADILHDMGCLHAVLDAFTSKLLTSFRQSFENLVEAIAQMRGLNERREELWVQSDVERGDSSQTSSDNGSY